MGFPRAPHVMAHFTGTELTGMLSNRYPLYAIARALVVITMGFPRAPYVMAHFACIRKAGMLLSYHQLRVGAVVCSDNRFIFCGAWIYLVAEDEQRCLKASRHDYHSIVLTAMTNDTTCLYVAVKHIWDWVRSASEAAHKYAAFVSSPCEPVHEFVAAHFLLTFFQRAITKGKLGKLGTDGKFTPF